MGLESPTDRDFFQKAKLVIEHTGIQSDGQFMEEVEHLIRTLAPMYGTKDTSLRFLDNPDLSLEQVMSLLDLDFKLFAHQTTPNLFLEESRELRVLKDLLARTLDYALEGPPCRKHRDLAEKMNAHDIVLSFNYDILMDNALYQAGKINDYSYGMNFYKVDRDGAWKGTQGGESDVSLFKLHGSLNWVRCGLCGSLLLYRYRKQIMLGAIEFHCPRCSSDRRFGQRMIIPPIQSKSYDRDTAFLWLQADRILKNVSRVICIGYSFPLTDFDMQTLIRRFLARQNKVPRVVFVSPDLEAENRLKKLLGTKETMHFNDLSSYLRADN